MANSADPDQMASSGSTLFAKVGYHRTMVKPVSKDICTKQLPYLRTSLPGPLNGKHLFQRKHELSTILYLQASFSGPKMDNKYKFI